MKLSNETLLRLYSGVYSVFENCGYLTVKRFTDEQAEYFKTVKISDPIYDRVNFTVSVKIEFITDATYVSFDYKIFKVNSFDSVDVYVNDFATHRVSVKSLTEEGTLKFGLPSGKKKVCVYLPVDANMGVKNFVINGKWNALKRKKFKVLWMGDSITQGCGVFASGQTGANVMNRIMNYDLLNQGTGGYWYDRNIVKRMPNYYPDKIIIAFGSNRYKDDAHSKMIEDFYVALHTVYPHVPVLVITPPWSGHPDCDVDLLERATKKIIATASEYPNVKVVDGFKLIPHLKDYYYDMIHPNLLGGETYGNNLAKEIIKLKF